MLKRILGSLALVGLTTVPLASGPAQACSRVLWNGNPGQVYVGRTQDWTEKVDSKFHKFPRGLVRNGLTPQNPLQWTSKYGSFVITGYDLGTHEGVNEKGLSDHLLFLADEASDFGERDTSRPGLNIAMWLQYYLDNFATVQEAVDAIERDDIQIAPIVFPNGKQSLLHLSLEDESGDSAVAEYVGGHAKVYHDRRFIVMTNEPTYDKQIANLKQYRSFGGDKALPGERTPADRFVRAAYYVTALPPAPNPETAVAYLFSVIRNVSVPFGAPDPNRPNVAGTVFRSVIDFSDQRYFFESTYAPNVVWVDYGKLDYSEGKPEEGLAVEQQIFSLSGNVTSKVEPVPTFDFGKS